jgi:competence protein ComEA
MKGWKAIAFGVLCGLLGAGLLLLVSGSPKGEEITLLPPPTPKPLQIHVSGAVENPGVYALPLDSRVLDAVMAAGGFTSDADQQVLNLASILQDGERVWVPYQTQAGGEPVETLPSSRTAPIALDDPTPSPPGDFPVNINTASQAELEKLPGIGPVTAQKIIEYRQTNGPFPSIEEIQKVSGIGPAKYEEIKDKITVGSSP